MIATDRATMNGKPVFTVPSKTVINFESGFAKKLLCDGPTFSTGTACTYSCAFCYVPSAMLKQVPWLEKQGVDGKHEDVVIRRENPVDIARRQLANAKLKPKWGHVIYASPLVDVAGNMELVKETVEMCQLILYETRWHIRLLSKSNLLPKIAQELEDHWSELRPKERIIYGVSTGTLDDGLAKVFEKGTPLVSKRIQSLHWLQDNGYRTFGMVCPSLPLPKAADYRAFGQRMARAIRYERCEHVWAEVINLRGESFTRTINALLAGGFTKEADQLKFVSTCPDAWEEYARNTYCGHIPHCHPSKLRFLQYVTNRNRDWWKDKPGAVML